VTDRGVYRADRLSEYNTGDGEFLV
jgi:hypothetical protein